MALVGDIGGGELLVVFAAILMLFGGKRLPSIARSIGRTFEDMRRASQDFRDQLMNADAGTPEGDVPPRPSLTTHPSAGQNISEKQAGTTADAPGTGEPNPAKETPSRDLAG